MAQQQKPRQSAVLTAPPQSNRSVAMRSQQAAVVVATASTCDPSTDVDILTPMDAHMTPEPVSAAAPHPTDDVAAAAAAAAVPAVGVNAQRARSPVYTGDPDALLHPAKRRIVLKASLVDDLTASRQRIDSDMQAVFDLIQKSTSAADLRSATPLHLQSTLLYLSSMLRQLYHEPVDHLAAELKAEEQDLKRKKAKAMLLEFASAL